MLIIFQLNVSLRVEGKKTTHRIGIAQCGDTQQVVEEVHISSSILQCSLGT